MKSYAIWHMVSSLDGRFTGSRRRPRGSAPEFERALYEQLGGDAWFIGHVTDPAIYLCCDRQISEAATITRYGGIQRRIC